MHVHIQVFSSQIYTYEIQYALINIKFIIEIFIIVL